MKKQSNERNLLRAASMLLVAALPSSATAQTTVGTALGTGESAGHQLVETAAELEEQRPATAIIAPTLPWPKSTAPFVWGPIEANLALNYRVLTGDNILSRPGVQEDTVLQEFSPSASLAFGRQWALFYTPRFSVYSSDAFEDTVSHNVRFQGAIQASAWILKLSQIYASSTDPLAETGTETETTSYITALSASRPLGERTSLDLTANQTFRDAQGFSSSKRWSTTEWLNYQVSSHINAGLGLGIGYTAVDEGSDMLDENFHARLQWRPGIGKFYTETTFGGEWRQFLDYDISSRLRPLFSVSAGYALTDATSFTLSANRSIDPSLLGDRITESTTLRLGIRQRFLGKMYLDVAPGFRFSDYQATTTGFVVDRHDENFFVSTRLSTAVLRKGRIGLFYTFNENTSDRAGFDFESQQFGLELGYRF